MEALTDDDVMPFGAHKGKRMEDVPARYLLWLWDEGWWQRTSEPFGAYLAASFDALLMDVRDYIPQHKPTKR